MPRPRTATLFFLWAAAIAPHAWAASPGDVPDPAAVLFSERCSTCHTIGGGVRVGPDLLGVTQRRKKEWVATFVRNPSKLIDAGDPIAAELFKAANGVRMPDQALSDADIDGLWSYFTACTDKGGCQPVSLGPKWGTDATGEEIEQGRRLFAGEDRLSKGGAPCFTCHDARGLGFLGGGTLGGDLTFAYARLGEKGIEPLLALPTTPVMAATYHDAALSAQEAYALKAYLAHLSRDGAPPMPEKDFFLLGLEGMGIALAGFTIVWGGRRKGERP